MGMWLWWYLLNPSTEGAHCSGGSGCTPQPTQCCVARAASRPVASVTTGPFLKNKDCCAGMAFPWQTGARVSLPTGLLIPWEEFSVRCAGEGLSRCEEKWRHAGSEGAPGGQQDGKGSCATLVKAASPRLLSGTALGTTRREKSMHSGELWHLWDYVDGGIGHLTGVLQWMHTGLSPLKRIGEVPNGWKKVRVPPILKKDKKGNLGNYMPSSLTSGLRKLGNKSPTK